MKVIRVHEYGDVAQLRLESVPTPDPAIGEVLVRTYAAGVNPYDWMTREGDGANVSFPWTPGWDLSGVVEAVGEGVSAYKPGDEVFGMLADERGTYAEYVAVPAWNVVRKPTSLSHAEAASAPMGSLTAWQALFDHGSLRPNQRVLIHAAAGGVGHAAVQLAGWIGAETVGTASESNRAFLDRLGLDEFVNYETERYEEVDPVDVVIDAVGGETLKRSLEALRSDGHVSKLPKPLTEADEIALDDHGATGSYPVVQWKPEQLRTIARLIDDEVLSVHVAETFSLDAVTDAHVQSQAGHTRGKIVLVPGED